MRVSRTIDFDTVTSCSSETESRSLPLTSLFYEPSKPLSLSPIASFPFRQNELASPDSPLSSTLATSVQEQRQIVPQTTRTAYKNESNSKFKGHCLLLDKHSPLQKISESINSNFKITPDVAKSCKNSLPNTYPEDKCNVYSTRSTTDTIDESTAGNTGKPIRKYSENIPNESTRLDCPSNSFISPIKTRQDISRDTSTSLQHIWRPIPLMAASTQEIVNQPLDMKVTDNQNHPSGTKQQNYAPVLPMAQAYKPVSVFQVSNFDYLSVLFSFLNMFGLLLSLT